MVGSGISLYLGAAIAVGLFDVFSPAAVAWFRIAGAAVILLALHRPKLSLFVGRAGVQAATYGIVTLAMNMTFYEAIARIPMGTAVAIEFLGPVVVAAIGSRGVRDIFSLILAVLGVVVISGAVWTDSATGLLLALAAGALWAVYIVVGSRISGETGWTSMAVGFTWAAALAAPVAFLLWPADTGMPVPTLIGLILGLGLLSAAIPYSLDQVVMRMAGSATFAVMQAILPIVAAIIGAVTLGQMLRVAEIIGIAMVVAAVALRRP